MSKLNLGPRFCLRLLALMLLATSVRLWQLSDSVLAEQPRQELYPLSEAEEWVLENVAAGNVANLEYRFPDEKDRVLRAAFIEKLLMGALEDAPIHRHGVRIKYAVFNEPLDLVNAQVAYQTWLVNCRFEDKVDLSWSNFHQFVNFYESRFKEASFNGMKVGGTAFLSSATFEGPVGFITAEIAGSFVADGVQFRNTDKVANFNSMKVGGTAFFKKATFEGPVDFTRAEIAGSFVADGVQFKNADKVAYFNSMKVGRTAFFNSATFQGPVDFISAEIASNFEADGAQFKNTNKKAIFHSMKVGGGTFFNSATFEGPVDLRDTQLGSLWIEAASWPTESASVELDGMTYKRISAGNEKDAWEKVLAWVDGSEYSAQPYVQLEGFFRAGGHPERADAVFVNQKRRERREVSGGPGSLAWWSNLFLDVLVRHGRSPERAFYWSGLVILIGTLVFRRREDMEPQKPQQTSWPYHPLWYSLDLFVPFVSLQAATMWAPKQNRRFARHYARVHTILGWTLIPIGLAALTGIIG